MAKGNRGGKVSSSGKGNGKTIYVRKGESVEDAIKRDEGRGRKYSLNNLLDMIKSTKKGKTNDKEDDIVDALQELQGKMNIEKPKFNLEDGVLRQQTAIIKDGSTEIHMVFLSDYAPKRIQNPNHDIKSSIDIVIWENGNPTAIRTPILRKTKSIKKQKQQYDEVKQIWQRITGQEKIEW